MALSLETLSSDFLKRLHPSAIEGSAAVRELMVRLWREGIELRRGVNRRISPELAWIERVDADRLRLATKNFERSRRPEIFLNFELDERPYFFAAPILGSTGDHYETRLPESVYRTERRDRLRSVSDVAGSPRFRVLLKFDNGPSVEGTLADSSAGGMGIEVRASLPVEVGSSVAIRFPDDTDHLVWHGRICHAGRSSANATSQHLGIALLGSTSRPLDVVTRASEGFSWRRARQAWDFIAAGTAARSEKLVRNVSRRARPSTNICVLNLQNSKGEEIRAIADFPGNSPVAGAPLVLIPPAWGRTKETLLPLASTIVATFERAGRPVSVVRFDGIRKRGESYNDPDCRGVGKEHHRFSFSQGVDDIRAVLDGLDANPAFQPSKVAMVTFSAAAIDGRRALTIDNGKRIAGWVSVVGSPDVQSMMRVVSGGLDYIGGVDRGLSFGIQEVLGVEVDIDRSSQDALDERLAYLDDSCRDMDAVRVPVTWIHGRDDAWMDLDRVRTMLSRGDGSKRKLIIVPTGHQLRTSKEAFEVFQLIAEEVSEILLGERLRARLPKLSEVESRRSCERARLPQPQIDRRAFWKRYLLGRDGTLGIDLMTSATWYRDFMTEQIAELGVAPGSVVADIGSGTGAFLSCLADLAATTSGVVVHELDYVREAFPRARAMLERSGEQTARASFIACDLAVDGSHLSIPMADSTYDAAIASLFISYVSDPLAVLQEIRRVIKPGGRLVVSGLRRDADVSKLCVDAIAEMAEGKGAGMSPLARGIDLELATRNFLNEASRLLDFEEEGLFQFRDSGELAGLLRHAGFVIDKVWTSLGDPAQAVVVAARRSVGA